MVANRKVSGNGIENIFIDANRSGNWKPDYFVFEWFLVRLFKEDDKDILQISHNFALKCIELKKND